jgi:hypothetical protein
MTQPGNYRGMVFITQLPYDKTVVAGKQNRVPNHRDGLGEMNLWTPHIINWR